MKTFFIVVAADENNGIGKDNKIPWHLPGEMKYFKNLTTGKQNMVIMGRNTWLSLPDKFRPLPNRKNVVLTRQIGYLAEGAQVYPSFEEALKSADDSIENVYVIGGQAVYEETVSHPQLAGIYLTRVHAKFDCDAVFPQIPSDFTETETLGLEQENGIKYEFLLYKKNAENS